jgi:predicted lipid carrier protein YhbT
LIRIKKSARRRLVLEGDTALGLEIGNALDALG